MFLYSRKKQVLPLLPVKVTEKLPLQNPAISFYIRTTVTLLHMDFLLSDCYDFSINSQILGLGGWGGGFFSGNKVIYTTW